MISSGMLRRFRYVLPLVHAALFVTACFLYLTSKEGFMGGKDYWFFSVLWVADIPISIFCFGLLWSGQTALGLVIWGVLGTLWWALIGWLLQTIIAAFSRRTT
jgi:hypothetical protein